MSQSSIFALCAAVIAASEFYFAKAELINEKYCKSVKSSANDHLCAYETDCGCNKL